jgi:hypothetical protein
MAGIGGFASYQAILSKVSEALQFVSAETDKAKASFEGLSDPRRRLSQIADPGTPGRSLDELEARVDTLAARFGEDREKVAGALFSAVSEGFEGALENIVRYGDVVDVGSASGVAGQVPSLFKGAISPDEAVSTTLLAARQSRLDFEQIAAAMPTIAAGAAMTGSTPTEAMGVLSVMAVL